MCYLLIVIRYLDLVVYASRAIIRSMFHLIYVGNCRFGVKQQNSKFKTVRQATNPRRLSSSRPRRRTRSRPRMRIE